MLNHARFKGKIKNLLNDLKDDENQEAAIDKYADNLATVIIDEIKQANITVTGTSVSGGAITGTGTIS